MRVLARLSIWQWPNLAIIRPGHQRINTATISKTGQQLQRSILEPLDEDEQAIFLALLSKLVHVNNAHSRAPLA